MSKSRDRDIPVVQINPADRKIVRLWPSYQSIYPNNKDKTDAIYKCCYRIIHHVDGQIYRFEDELIDRPLVPVQGEQWAPIDYIDGYDCSNFAEVSDTGRVRFAHGNKLPLRMKLDKDGNYIVKLRYNRTMMRDFRVHRLVANAFLPHRLLTEKLVVKHLDGDRTNNLVENLQWCEKNGIVFVTKREQ